MSFNLLFRFLETTAETDSCEWLSADHSIRRGTLHELAREAAGRQPVLIVPGEHITLTRVRLPGRNRSTWYKAIPYALEEQLADDVEQLHFALGTTTPAGDIPVAVVRKSLLQDWLERCREAGLSPTAVIPDYLLLPLAENSWSIAADSDRVLLRNGPWSGFSCDLALLPIVLERALAADDTASPEARDLLLYCGSLSSSLSLPSGLTLQQPLRRDEHSQNHELLALLADAYDNTAHINLLQNTFSPRSPWRERLRPWQLAATLAGLWLASQLALQGVEYVQLKREQALLQQSMVDTFRRAVPEARRIVNPRAQLENRLRELGSGNAVPVAAFFDLLQHGGRSLLDFKTVTLLGLRYKDNQLDLELEGSNLAVFDRLKQHLSNQTDLNVEMHVSKRENKVAGRITLNKG